MKCKQVSLSTLQVGAVLMAPITDPLNPQIKLLAEGAAITQEFLDQLKRRQVDHVVLSSRDLAMMHAFSPQGRLRKVPPSHQYVQSKEKNDQSVATDKIVESDETLEVPRADRPLLAEIQKPVDCGYCSGLQMHWARKSSEQIETVSDFFDDTVRQGNSDVAPLYQTCFDLLDRIAEDQDALVCLAVSPFDADYPSRHGVHLAGVALCIGVEMGLDRGSLIDLGVGCLVHDVGMQAVGLPMFDTKTTLSPRQLKRLSDHPVKAIEIAGRYGNSMTLRSKLVAYQIHERLDGSGYPRGRVSDQIHPLAKIAAVADAFVGMLSNRKHRLAIQGYYAITRLLEDVKNRKHDPRVLRALLHCTSLYPLGSFVTLNNDKIGRVIRAGGQEFARPTIEMWDIDQLNQPPAIVNLKHEGQMRIVSTIPVPQVA